MTHIVTNNCVKCKHMECVAVCPVDCIYEGENMVVINPEECIDCGACEPECPTTAIFHEADLPAEHKIYKSINEGFTCGNAFNEIDMTGWPQALKDGLTIWPALTISERYHGPLPDAAAYENQPNKLTLISPKPGTSRG